MKQKKRAREPENWRAGDVAAPTTNNLTINAKQINNKTSNPT